METADLTFTPDPALAETIRQAIRQHVAELNARAADALDAAANSLHARAADLRGASLELAA